MKPAIDSISDVLTLVVGMDATTIIEAFGGYTALAEQLGVGRSTVFMWQRSGIPKARCLELSKLAKKRRLRRITLERLLLSKPREIIVKTSPPPSPQRGARAAKSCQQS